jgi:hypothetical protein
MKHEALKPESQPTRFDRSVRAVCRARCEWYSMKPCFEDGGEWPNEECEPDCRTIAALAVAAWNMLPPPPKGA